MDQGRNASNDVSLSACVRFMIRALHKTRQQPLAIVTATESVLKKIKSAARAGTITIVARPRDKPGRGYPKEFSDYRAVPKEVFIGPVEIHLGASPYPIIQRGDDIFNARWFYPRILKSDVLKLVRDVEKKAPRKKRQPQRDIVRRALRELYPTGVPSRDELSDSQLFERVDKSLKKAGISVVSRETVLRAAGRK